LVTMKKNHMANRDTKGHALIRSLPARKSVGNGDTGTKVRFPWSEWVNNAKNQLTQRFS